MTWRLLACASLVAAALSPIASAAEPSLLQYRLPDPHLGCTAWTFLAPAGWEVRGGVSWTGQLVPVAYSTRLTVRNPRGSEEFSFFPVFLFADTSQPILGNGLEIRHRSDAAAVIREVLVPRVRPGIRPTRLVGPERLPSLARATVERAAASGLPRMQADSARLLIEYTAEGRAMEEMVYCTIVALPSRGVTFWGVERAFSYRAERGKLQQSFPLLGTIAASMIESPQWVKARRRELNRLVAAHSPPPRTIASGPSILDVSKQISRNNDEFLRNVDRSFSARLNSPGLAAWTDAYRGVSHMENPATHERIDVQNGYQRYFQDNLGRVIGSNDVIGDPFVNYRIDATELQPR